MDPNDTTYATQLLAWLVLWSATGWGVRQWLAGKDSETHR